MFSTYDSITLGVLIVSAILLTILLNYVLKRKNKKQLDKMFVVLAFLMLLWVISDVLQLFGVTYFNINPIYFDYFTYIPICFVPVAFLFLALTFAKTKISFKMWYFLLFIIPSLSILLLWTNNLHHLFYKEYNLDMSTTVFGDYFNIHYAYTYILLGISLFILLKYSIKNSGFFSRQAILMLLGAFIPIVTNILGFVKVIPMSIYITPITFTLSVIFFAFAMFKFNLFKATPIALQRIVDRMSDSYLVLDEDNMITDFNATFLDTFNLKSTNVRNRNIFDLISSSKAKLIDTEKLCLWKKSV